MGRGKYLKLSLFLFLVLLLTNSVSSKVEDKVVQNLNEGKDARVIILLDSELNTKESQKNVLSKFVKGDFQLTQRFSIYPALAGIVKNKKALEKLQKNNVVKAVYEDKILYASLAESVPLINAHLANYYGYTGEGIGVCILDTGVDYTHPYLGNSSCSILVINGSTEPESVENSRHPYQKNTNETFTITKPGYENIAVHFERLETEKNWDFVYILDPYDNIVQEFSGEYADVWSISIPGDTIKINLVSDGYIQDWGFEVDTVLNGTAEFLWQNCGNIVDGYDFENLDYYPFDDNGHGTHVAGIVASSHPTYQGVAYNVDIIAHKVLDADGYGYFSSSAAAIEWCIEHKDEYNIKIISMSLGNGGQYNSPANCPTDPPAALISQAKSAGIATIIASGNNAHNNGISFPACVSDAISVGASYDANVGSVYWSSCTDLSTYADEIVCFTNTDELLDVMAPGALITSTVPTGGCEICHPSGFDTIGGTSMAAPMVSALAALHLEKNSTLTPDALLEKLKESDTNVTDPDNGLSFPRVDAINVLDNPFTLTLMQGWNLVTLPLDLTYTAESLGQFIGADTITQYDGTSQKYIGHIIGTPIDDFNIDLGMGIFVYVTSDVNVTFSGNSTGAFSRNTYSGWNGLGWPDQDPILASELGDEITGTDTVARFLAHNQTWESHIMGAPANNFTINLGDGVFVFTNTNSTWNFVP